MINAYHIPVMLDECMKGLAIKPDGKYVDATFGGGGHSKKIIEALDGKGKLYAFDQDDDAIAQAFESDKLMLVKANFKYIKNYLDYFKASPVDGVLADLGISSYQIDEKERGFAFMQEGPLDMRMNKDKGESVKDWLERVDERTLIHVLSAYGEIKNARSLAQAIRAALPLKTTKELAQVCTPFAPKHKLNSYLARVFQAFRIHINQELEALKAFLEQLEDCVAEDGRVVIMSYHSLEDRLVKRWLQSGNIEGKIEKDFYGNVLRPFVEIERKPVTASAAEVAINSRARSAKLRIAIRVKQ